MLSDIIFLGIILVILFLLERFNFFNDCNAVVIAPYYIILFFLVGSILYNIDFSTFDYLTNVICFLFLYFTSLFPYSNRSSYYDNLSKEIEELKAKHQAEMNSYIRKYNELEYFILEHIKETDRDELIELLKKHSC